MSHRFRLYERDNADDRLITSARLLGELFEDIEELGHSEWLIRDCWKDRWINPDEFWNLLLRAEYADSICV